MQHEGISVRMSLYLIGGPVARLALSKCVQPKVREISSMKVSLIALYACCAVSSAAFAYQNNPQSGQSAHFNASGARGGQFVMRDDPGANIPKAVVMDDPGAN